MTLAATLDPDRPVLDQLREKVSALEGGPARLPVPVLPALSGLVALRTGGSYGVDSASLGLALAAGASAAGEWIGFAGWPDFGAEAAADLGVDLERTVLVPDVGEHWLEVTAALVDVLRVVVLRPPARVDARAAGVLDARLRKRSSVLVVWGDWPRCEARLSLEDARWTGPEQGQGRLRSRQVRVAVRRGTAPPVRADLAFPGDGAPISLVSTDAPAATGWRRSG
ncbi:hypothetical protein G5V58_10760 [Nocardioides anomalus]|uniref:Uncharacterized protein n=1 Tax=Nocardioides anomalus TaxID=2712223 RepID=A0A6G6WD52_9ACTN|nr:hypothetical protein [Nocardioides anomalus]QIG43172.1 hypothetical protein G5V58_10760 [Nocardioides anomalus]